MLKDDPRDDYIVKKEINIWKLLSRYTYFNVTRAVDYYYYCLEFKTRKRETH